MTCEVCGADEFVPRRPPVRVTLDGRTLCATCEVAA